MRGWPPRFDRAAHLRARRERRKREGDRQLGPLAQHAQRHRKVERHQIFDFVATRTGHDQDAVGRAFPVLGRRLASRNAPSIARLPTLLDALRRRSPRCKLLDVARVDRKGAVEERAIAIGAKTYRLRRDPSGAREARGVQEIAAEILHDVGAIRQTLQPRAKRELHSSSSESKTRACGNESRTIFASKPVA